MNVSLLGLIPLPCQPVATRLSGCIVHECALRPSFLLVKWIAEDGSPMCLARSPVVCMQAPYGNEAGEDIGDAAAAEGEEASEQTIFVRPSRQESVDNETYHDSSEEVGTW